MPPRSACASAGKLRLPKRKLGDITSDAVNMLPRLSFRSGAEVPPPPGGMPLCALCAMLTTPDGRVAPGLSSGELLLMLEGVS